MDIYDLNRVIVTRQLSKLGFGGECLNFAVAMHRILNRGTYYGAFLDGENTPDHVVLICDGYMMDCGSFMPVERFMTRLNENGLKLEELQIETVEKSANEDRVIFFMSLIKQIELRTRDQQESN